MTMPLVDVLASGFNLFAVIMQEKIVFKDICESPVKWGALKELPHIELRRLT